MGFCFNEKDVIYRDFNSDFNELPERLRDEILTSTSITKIDEGFIEFMVKDSVTSRDLAEKVKRYIKNKKSANYRKESMLVLSGGVYEQSDIDEIYGIQQGLCYYTRQQLSKNEKNFSIDHIRPVTIGGSSWPGNLALVLKDVNKEKRDLSKNVYFSMLGQKYGEEWLKQQRSFCKQVGLKRGKVHKKRRATVQRAMKEIEDQLLDEFVGCEIEYSLVDDHPTLYVDYTCIEFPVGFIRQKKKFGSCEYLAGIIRGYLNE